MASNVIQIVDASSGATAHVLVSFGFNCFQFQARPEDRPIDVLWSEDGFESGNLRPSGSGIPLLFPYPGRLKGKTLDWKGRGYDQETDDGRGNAIHGLVHTRPWRVVNQRADKVVGQFQASRDDPLLLQMWPADFRITVGYQVQGNSLLSDIVVENPCEQELPFGLGTHPYFRVPLGAEQADRCVVTVPVSKSWELIDLVPTGAQKALDATELPTGMSFGKMELDHIFTGLTHVEGIAAASIHDPDSGRTMTMKFDNSFRQCVVYNPPHRQAVCIEPYTCVPDAVRLAKEDVTSGLRVLGPGESWRGQINIQIS